MININDIPKALKQILLVWRAVIDGLIIFAVAKLPHDLDYMLVILTMLLIGYFTAVNPGTRATILAYLFSAMLELSFALMLICQRFLGINWHLSVGDEVKINTIFISTFIVIFVTVLTWRCVLTSRKSGIGGTH